ncbi:MAG: iron ABC transporter permease [Spirochaetales bacterium]|nr:iron ABC transporter permease [Spirochaetales bacterium]
MPNITPSLIHRRTREVRVHPRRTLYVTGAAVVALGLAALAIGRYHVSPATILGIMAEQFLGTGTPASSVDRTVLLAVRLPRVATAMLVGAALATSGATLQGVFRNPLVSPGILGVSAGAGLGAALCILLVGRNAALVQLSAFVCGIFAMLTAVAMSGRAPQRTTLMLVLSGVIVSASAEALISLVKYTADPEDTLPAIVYWLMGSLSGVTAASLGHIVVPIAGGLTVLILIRWRINVLSLGDAEARSLGVNVAVSRSIAVAATTVVTAAAISVAGVVGWVGLVVPHIARMLVGPDHRLVIPLSAMLGSGYLLIIDTLARSATSGEIPLGILTALLGAPVFAVLLRRTGGMW